LISCQLHLRLLLAYVSQLQIACLLDDGGSSFDVHQYYTIYTTTADIHVDGVAYGTVLPKAPVLHELKIHIANHRYSSFGAFGALPHRLLTLCQDMVR